MAHRRRRHGFGLGAPAGMGKGKKLALAGIGVVFVGGVAYLLLAKPSTPGVATGAGGTPSQAALLAAAQAAAASGGAPVALMNPGGLPVGDYQATCRNCAASGSSLSCQCETQTGAWTPTTIANASCPPGSALSNCGGVLVCRPLTANCNPTIPGAFAGLGGGYYGPNGWTRQGLDGLGDLARRHGVLPGGIRRLARRG